MFAAAQYLVLVRYIVFHLCAGISGPPPGEVVEGLRNPYIDEFLPKRRKEASKAYQDYKPIMPKYFHMAMKPDMSDTDEAALDTFLSDLEAVIQSGTRFLCSCFLCSSRVVVMRRPGRFRVV